MAQLICQTHVIALGVYVAVLTPEFVVLSVTGNNSTVLSRVGRELPLLCMYGVWPKECLHQHLNVHTPVVFQPGGIAHSTFVTVLFAILRRVHEVSM